MLKNIIGVLLIIALVIIIGFMVIKPTPQTDKQDTHSAQKDAARPERIKLSRPPMMIDSKLSYTAVIRTEKGDITISLHAKETPKTVNNFVALSRLNYYNNTPFHRVLKGFMIQGGDPNGDGTGGPGYQFEDEPFTGEYSRGTVAMANAGPNTNGSQFFIMQERNDIAKNYVIFGNVVKGIEVVDTIANEPVTTRPTGEESKPVTPIKITSVEIVEK